MPRLPRLVLTLLLALAWVSPAAPQAMKCPVCMGANKALQYTGDTCVCGTISAPAGPQGPPGPAGTMPASTCPVEGYTERWNGTAWVCTPTKYLIGE
jgi:hypothetical protein